MLPLVSVTILLVLVLFIPICVCLEYSDRGFAALLKIFFFKISLTGEKKNKSKSGKKSVNQKNEKKPGNRKILMDVLTPMLDALGHLIKCIVVKKLIMNISIGGKDAFSAAVSYGSAAAGVGILFPFLDSGIKIKKKTISVTADFTSEDIAAYLFADIRIFFVQLLAVAVCFVYKYLKKINTEKGIKHNG